MSGRYEIDSVLAHRKAPPLERPGVLSGPVFRLAGRVQLTSDSHGMDRGSVDENFGADGDYGQVVKVYGNDSQGETPYSPAVCISCEQKSLIGNPIPSTSAQLCGARK